MSRFRLILALVTIVFAGLAVANEFGAHIKPGLGVAVPAEFNTVISADGNGLPAGRGSVTEGKQVYRAKCAACHGADGRQAGNALRQS